MDQAGRRSKSVDFAPVLTPGPSPASQPGAGIPAGRSAGEGRLRIGALVPVLTPGPLRAGHSYARTVTRGSCVGADVPPRAGTGARREETSMKGWHSLLALLALGGATAVTGDPAAARLANQP